MTAQVVSETSLRGTEPILPRPDRQPAPDYKLGDVLLRIEDVSLTLGDTRILRGVTGQVMDIIRPGCTQGQVIGLLGPSGSGKTQMSRILAGLQEPTSGSVLVDNGHGKLEPVRAGVMGMVAQDYPLFEHRTVHSNLQLAVRMARPGRWWTSLPRLTADEQISIDRMVTRFGMQDRLDHYPAQLSGGQRQRVAIIQQLLCSNEFLIMDEPFANLDPRMEYETCQLLTEVASLHDRMTIIVIAHNIRALVAVADHLWVLGPDRKATGAEKDQTGSRIQRSYDLIERGLAWHSDCYKLPEFEACVREVTELFYA